MVELYVYTFPIPVDITCTQFECMLKLETVMKDHCIHLVPRLHRPSHLDLLALSVDSCDKDG